MSRKKKRQIKKLAKRLELIPDGSRVLEHHGPVAMVQVHLRDEVGKAVRLAIIDVVKRRVPEAQVQVFEESELMPDTPLHILKTDTAAGFDFAGMLQLMAPVRRVVANA